MESLCSPAIVPWGPWGLAVQCARTATVARLNLERALSNPWPGPCHCPVPCVCRRDQPFEGLLRILAGPNPDQWARGVRP